MYNNNTTTTNNNSSSTAYRRTQRQRQSRACMQLLDVRAVTRVTHDACMSAGNPTVNQYGICVNTSTRVYTPDMQVYINTM